MNLKWSEEPAARGGGSWFVGIGAELVVVLVPPGVHARWIDSDQDRNRGWWRAEWLRDTQEWPRIDLDPPHLVVALDTCAALQVLERELHDSAWNLLLRQVEIARSFGGAPRRRARSEDKARAGAVACAWLESELWVAFPSRRHLLNTGVPPAGMTSTSPPDTYADFVRLTNCEAVDVPDPAEARGRSARLGLGNVARRLLPTLTSGPRAKPFRPPRPQLLPLCLEEPQVTSADTGEFVVLP